jgi:bzd-type benzoyl-CoA reductase N subunit
VLGIDDLKNVVNSPYEYARRWKADSGKKVIGFFCSYTPEELITAADALPLRLFGSVENITHADAHLQPYSCSLVRGALEEALSGKLDFLDGTVFPHTCDSIQRLSDIWRLNTSFGFLADVVLPVKLDTESAREYMVDLLHKFRSDLERWLDIAISDEKIRESIEIYNGIRRYLKRIYEIKSNNPGSISGKDIHTIVKSSMMLDRRVLVERLSEIVHSLEEVGHGGKPDKKRIVLSGGICNHPDVYSLIEESGGVVVWDDLCTGSRYFNGEIKLNGDPIAAIADRYIGRVICPAKHATNYSRGENLIQVVKDNNAQGVLFLLLKFCDPHAFDYPYMKEYLDREGIPSLLLEVEDQLPSEGQLKTRFEAFFEMLK